MAAPRLEWDVFLSFRGEDTRRTVTSHLHSFLHEQGVRVFLDDVGLNRGDEIAPGLLEAIDDSAAFIIIISPKYASSHWCLEEMARICELGRLILPVFYGVDPSHVRHQRGPFQEDFEKHKSRFRGEQVEEWSKAMAKVGGIAGWVFKNISSDDVTELVKSLGKRVLHELSNNPMVVATYSVGLDSRVEELMKLVNAKAPDIQILGLHGIGGVGTTTLAKALYNKLVGQFEKRSFISDVREQHKINGLVSLQNKIISNLTEVKFPRISEVHAGISEIKGIVYERQVLIVLDDVDNVTQLEALVGKREWFHEGSRIIITTRDRQILHENYVNQIYEVRELNPSQALQLFSHHALRREKPTDDLLNLSEKIVSLTGGLPLALEVIGSFLSDKGTIREWEDSLKKLRRIRPCHLQDVLKFSFDGLDEEAKCIFLDIACLFVKIDMKREDAVDIMKGCGFEAKISISVLEAKSLIKITEDDYFWMHDQLRDMGRQIVREQDLVDPGMRSRLWDRDEILTLLENNKGTRNIQGIVLDLKKDFVKDPSGVTISRNNLLRRPNIASASTYLKEVCMKYFQDGEENEKQVVLYTKPFEPMVNLRLLEINQVKLVGNFKHFPVGLKWLQWKGCPLRSLPSNFQPRQLAVLDLSESNIIQVWGRNTKVAENLMVLNLKGCHNLESIDLSGHRNLQKIVLQRCSKITKLHKSIGSLSTLLFLNMEDCTNLVEFPSDVSGLKNLETLILSGCSQLKELPKSMGPMRSLKELHVDKTAIACIPESIFHLSKLEKFSLDGCQSLKRLPNCIGMLVSLKELTLRDTALEELPHSIGDLVNLEKLSLMWCKSLEEVPNNIGNLKSLTEFLIDASAIRELPSSVGSLLFLKILSAGNCESLSRLPDSIEGLASTVELQLGGPLTALPENIGSLKTLQKLNMRNCPSLISLPAKIGDILTLTSLTMYNVGITELPGSFGLLENLVILRLNKCKKLNKLPSSMGNLKSLHRFWMDESAVIEIPESLGMLSGLIFLRMTKRPLFRLPRNREPAKDDTEERPTLVLLPTSLSNLSLLEELDARAFGISGRIPDEFEKLSSLQILNLGNNDFYCLPCSLGDLSLLKKLYLPYCENLKSLPPLPSSLQELNLADCFGLESVSDLSNLENLLDLNMTNCEKVVDIPGLRCLKSLKRLYLSGCSACSSAVKRRLSKVCLKNIHNVSVPGSRIPDWFSQGRLRFSKHQNLEVKGVIIGVVVSLDHQITDDLRNQIPVIPDIQAKILKLGEPIYTTALQLMGVPRTNDDQIHLCRYPHFNPLVSKLKDGYEIEVTTINPPYVEGVELKMSGAHLVYENDDDYDGNEELLDESQKSVSERLANFFNSMHEQED